MLIAGKTQRGQLLADKVKKVIRQTHKPYSEGIMPLFLNNEEIDQILTMKDTMDA
jgi:hypothetical protein